MRISRWYTELWWLRMLIIIISCWLRWVMMVIWFFFTGKDKIPGVLLGELFFVFFGLSTWKWFQIMANDVWISGWWCETCHHWKQIWTWIIGWVCIWHGLHSQQHHGHIDDGVSIGPTHGVVILVINTGIIAGCEQQFLRLWLNVWLMSNETLGSSL